MRSFRNEHRSRTLSLAVGVSLALSMGAAIADSSKSAPKADEPGLMKFEHVRVVNTPSAATNPAKKQASNSARVYVDPTNLNTRDATIEELNANAAAAPASANSGATTTGAEINLNDGGVGIAVPDESVVYQVAHKGKTGVTSSEVYGPAAADKAVKSKVEVSHDR